MCWFLCSKRKSDQSGQSDVKLSDMDRRQAEKEIEANKRKISSLELEIKKNTPKTEGMDDLKNEIMSLERERKDTDNINEQREIDIKLAEKNPEYERMKEDYNKQLAKWTELNDQITELRLANFNLEDKLNLNHKYDKRDLDRLKQDVDDKRKKFEKRAEEIDRQMEDIDNWNRKRGEKILERKHSG